MNIQTIAPLCALALASAAPSAAHAAIEDLGADNGSIATAQPLGALVGDTALELLGIRGAAPLAGQPVVDDSRPDFYSFEVDANQQLTLRVDTPQGPVSLNDPVLALFAADGSRLGRDDDGGPGYDSLLKVVIRDAGTYYAAVSGFDDFNFNGVADLFEDENNGPEIPSTNFSYSLKIAATEMTAVPLPAAGWLLGSALLGLARRRKAA